MSSSNDKAILNSIFNPLLPLGEMIYDEDLPPQLKDEEENEDKDIQILETSGVKEAEAGNVTEALNIFNDAVAKAPNRASCYNNRAQAYRLLGRKEDALGDLNKAIELSNGKGKAACQAFVQRAMLLRLSDKEDEARKDFESAAKMGSEFAKAQLVQLNPYAAMCNKMLSQVIGQLQRGEVSNN